MSIQPLSPTGYGPSASDIRARLAQATASGKTQQQAVDDIVNGTDTLTAGGMSLDQLFNTDNGNSGDGSLASYLGATDDSSDGGLQSVFDSFTTEAKATLLQAQEKGGTGTAAGTTTDPTTNATSASAALDLQIQQLFNTSLASMLGSSTTQQNASLFSF